MGSQSRPFSAVLLFDIDGTLLRRAGPHHRQALVSAVRHVTGIETSNEHIATQGMLDRDILKLMMLNVGMKPKQIAIAMPAIIAFAQMEYQSTCPDLRRKVCPGVRRFLGTLRKRNTVAGLVTGNLTAIGWRKMESAGLRHHFQFGAFAEQGRDRAALVRIALRQAKQHGFYTRQTPVALIGDHPNDVNAARQNGVRAVAVTTGLTSREELSTHNPHMVVDNLNSLDWEKLFLK